MCRHVVANQGGVDAPSDEFPCGESRSLEQRARFGHEHVESATLLMGCKQDSQRGPIVGCGQTARVAVSQYSGMILNQPSPMEADSSTNHTVLVLDRPCLTQQPIHNL